MESLKFNEQSREIILTPQDVESAVRQFICDCLPEYKTNWILNPKYNLGTVVFVGTEGDEKEKVQCQCGKYVNIEDAVMDEDGCWTCSECLKEMQNK